MLGRITSWAGKGDKAGYRKVDSLKTGKPKYKEVHKLAVNVMKKKDPKFPFTSIQFNKNKQMKKHKDAKNVGESYIIGLGNYTGGELIVYNTDGKSEKKMCKYKKTSGTNLTVVHFHTRLLHLLVRDIPWFTIRISYHSIL